MIEAKAKFYITIIKEIPYVEEVNNLIIRTSNKLMQMIILAALTIINYCCIALLYDHIDLTTTHNNKSRYKRTKSGEI